MPYHLRNYLWMAIFAKTGVQCPPWDSQRWMNFISMWNSRLDKKIGAQFYEFINLLSDYLTDCTIKSGWCSERIELSEKCVYIYMLIVPQNNID
jgi:hypothetical protein